MHYLIHTNIFKEPHYNELVEFIERNGLSHEIVPFKPFVEELEIEYTGKDIWCWGSVSMSRLAKTYGWQPGSMLNDNHDLEVYAMHYGEDFLNWDGEIMPAGSPLPDWADYFFARPTKDSKAFSGELFSREKWEQWIPEAIKPGNITGGKPFTANTRVLIAPLRHNIQQEVRCWVVDGKVITASRYKLGARVSYENYDNESFYVDFAQRMVDKYQPAEAFVIDVCLSDDQLKVVEINCINCAGFYHANMSKLMTAVENHFVK